MRPENPLPRLWLLSDERNDHALEQALGTLPRGSGFVFRHYHLAGPARRARFEKLRRLCRKRGHLVLLAGSLREARHWRAEGAYGAPARLGPPRAGLLAIVAAHNPREIARAQLYGADAIMLSPVFATRSHPGGETLGPVRFRLLSSLASIPLIALGGMHRKSAARLGWPRWAAIDGLSS